MRELVKLLDENFEYESHESSGGTLYIYVVSNRKEAACPNCGLPSDKVHSWYKRRFKDLPIQGMKVELVLNNRVLFCKNDDCPCRTFAETFDCLPRKAKRSRRLTEKIVNISLEVSSVTASEILRDGIADVGKSTVCSLLKKRHATN